MTIEQLASTLTTASVLERMFQDMEIDLSHQGVKIVLDYKNKTYIYKRYHIHDDFKLVCIGVGSTILSAWINRTFKNDDPQKFNEWKEKYEDVLDIANARISFDPS